MSGHAHTHVQCCDLTGVGVGAAVVVVDVKEAVVMMEAAAAVRRQERHVIGGTADDDNGSDGWSRARQSRKTRVLMTPYLSTRE